MHEMHIDSSLSRLPKWGDDNAEQDWNNNNMKTRNKARVVVTRLLVKLFFLFFCRVDYSILINWASQFQILGASGVLFHFYVILTENPLSKQCRPWSDARDLGLHCLPRSQTRDTRIIWVKPTKHTKNENTKTHTLTLGSAVVNTHCIIQFFFIRPPW